MRTFLRDPVPRRRFLLFEVELIGEEELHLDLRGGILLLLDVDLGLWLGRSDSGHSNLPFLRSAGGFRFRNRRKRSHLLQYIVRLSLLRRLGLFRRSWISGTREFMAIPHFSNQKSRVF